MFVSSVNQLENMSKDELWRIASNRTTAHSIRRAAIRFWMSLDARETGDGAAQRSDSHYYPRLLRRRPEDQPA